MKPVLYIDMLFLFNLFMNSITVFMTSLLLKKHLSALRVLGVSAFLALYSSFMFFPDISILYSVLGKAFILTLSSVMAFGKSRKLEVLKNAFVFFSVSAGLGGIILALIFTTSFGTAVGSIVSNGEIYLNIKASLFLFAIAICYAFIYTISFIKKQALVKDSNIVKGEITFFSKSVHFWGFRDTGCQLLDPVSGYGALIIGPRLSKKLLPHHILKSIKNSPDLSKLGEFSSRYRILPFYTIDKKDGFLHGFIPCKVVINGIIIKKCVVAISDFELSQNLEFDAIFNPMLTQDFKDCMKKGGELLPC